MTRDTNPYDPDRLTLVPAPTGRNDLRKAQLRSRDTARVDVDKARMAADVSLERRVVAAVKDEIVRQDITAAVKKAVRAALAPVSCSHDVRSAAAAKVAVEKARPPRSGIVAPTPPPKPLVERIAALMAERQGHGRQGQPLPFMPPAQAEGALLPQAGRGARAGTSITKAASPTVPVPTAATLAATRAPQVGEAVTPAAKPTAAGSFGDTLRSLLGSGQRP